MNLQFLKTLIAVSETPTFFAASQALSLSHSTVSLQLKALEDELGVPLFDRSHRTPVLTDRGLALVEYARRIEGILDEIASLGSDESLVGSLTVGVVSTALIHLVPPALSQLRLKHPRLKISLKTGFSDDLAQRVRNQEMDVAIATMPDSPVEGIRTRAIGPEGLQVIASAEASEQNYETLLASHPFIWFNRKTWVGQQIERHLINNKITVKGSIEVDSLEAIEALVRHGMGVSITPQTIGSPPLSKDLKAFPFGTPQLTRVMAMLERPKNPKKQLTDALFTQLKHLSDVSS